MTAETQLGNGKRALCYQPQPAEPSGKPWDEDKVAKLYPKLAGKYGYTG